MQMSVEFAMQSEMNRINMQNGREVLQNEGGEETQVCALDSKLIYLLHLMLSAGNQGYMRLNGLNYSNLGL